MRRQVMCTHSPFQVGSCVHGWLLIKMGQKNPPPFLKDATCKEGRSDQSLPGKPSTCAKTAPAVSRSCFLLSHAEPFWRTEAGLAFVFSGLRSGWASGHRFPSRNFLRGEISWLFCVSLPDACGSNNGCSIVFREGAWLCFYPDVDGCARGASRWAVKEGRLAEVGGRGGQLGCASFAFTFSLFLGISRTVMGFGWGMKSDEGA